MGGAVKKEMPNEPGVTAEPATTLLPYEPGDTIPGTSYKVERVLGAGGMGCVLLVNDQDLHVRRVVKMPQFATLEQRPDVRSRFLSEARTAARLRHRNIVQVFAFGNTSDKYSIPYFVMEYIDGQDIRNVLRKGGRLALHETLNIAIEILDGLHFAHLNGVIHKDLKPENVFLERQHPPVPRIIDFGLSAGIGPTSKATQTGYFQGTAAYAAPEQFKDEPLTTRTDLYAAGVMFWEILVGRLPFEGPGDFKAMSASHRTQVPPRVSEFVPVPRELDDIIASMLAKDPEKRPKSAYWVGSRFRAILVDVGSETKNGHHLITNPDTIISVLEQGGLSNPRISGQNTPVANYDVPTLDTENGATQPETPKWMLELWAKEEERLATLRASEEARFRQAPTRTLPVAESKPSPSMAARATVSADPQDNLYMESPLDAERAMAVGPKTLSPLGRFVSGVRASWRNGVLSWVVAGVFVGTFLVAIYLFSDVIGKRYVVPYLNKRAEHGTSGAAVGALGSAAPAPVSVKPSTSARREEAAAGDASIGGERSSRAAPQAK